MDPMFEALDIKYLLLENYKALGLQEKHVMVLLMLDHLIKQENHLVTAELLSLKMSLPIEEIDGVMVDLLNRQWIEFITWEGKTTTSLRPLKTLLHKRFQQHLIQHTQEVNLEDQASIFQLIEKAFARTLSPLEISRIQDWLTFGYSQEMIQASLQDAIAKQKKSIRHMDKYLQKVTLKETLAQEGTTMNSQHLKDIQHTLTNLDTFSDHESKNKK